MAECAALLPIAQLTVALAQAMLTGKNYNLAKQNSAKGDIGNRMSNIRRELLVIQQFLSQLDLREGENPCLETWMEEVRTVAYRTQDLVDKHIHIVSQEQGYKFGDFTRKALHRHPMSIALSDIDTELTIIEKDLTNISQRKDRWIQMPNRASERLTHQATSSHLVDEGDIVGIEENREILAKLLQSEDSSLNVVSVWGMDGLGKTTLVANVYKRESPNFSCHAWISISQSYKIDDILRMLIKKLYGEDRSVPDDVGSMDDVELKEILRIFLEHKRYLIVLDDVQNQRVFHDLRHAFGDNHQGSRIIITTRNDDVASLAHDQCKLQLKPLGGGDEAWDLFCKRAFSKEKDHVCPSEIEISAKKIVAKCEGLPLAIVSFARLLSPKKTKSEWERVYRKFSWEFENNPILENLRNVLNQSYKDLPTYLKNCFLHCSMFPEDYLLDKEKLIRLWIAEGFVEERGSNTLEEVAEDYLKELTERSMLQIVEMNHTSKFHVHNLMRELGLLVSKRARFHAVYNGSTTTLRLDNDTRRLAVWNCTKDMLSGINMPLLRAFIALHSNVLPSKFLSSNLSNSKYLAVLDMEGTGIETVGDEILELFNLRYLCFRNSKVKSLPESIEKLSNLETLDLSGSMIKKLPCGFVELKKLRYLNVMEVKDEYGNSTPLEAPEGLCDLKELQTLEGVNATRDLVKGLKNLSKLRSLAIWDLKDFHLKHLTASLSKMDILSRLALSINCTKLDVRNMVSGHQLLRDGWLPTLQSLRELQIKGCNTNNTILLAVAHQMKYEGEELLFRAGCFPNLHSLIIEDMSFVNRVKMEKETMVNLHTLVLKGLEELREVPQGIEFLLSLQQLEFSNTQPELMTMLQQSQVKRRLQHIAEISIK